LYDSVLSGIFIASAVKKQGAGWVCICSCGERIVIKSLISYRRGDRIDVTDCICQAVEPKSAGPVRLALENKDCENQVAIPLP
jgi:hypothetical protein